MALEDRLVEWDGKSIEFLATLYEENHAQSDLTEVLIDLFADPHLQAGATWLLKRHLDSGHSLSPNHIAAVVDRLDRLQVWHSKLHVLQCLPRWQLTGNQREQAHAFIEHGLNDPNKFVRAWSYGALEWLARQDVRYRTRAAERLAWATENEAASVKARIRQVLRDPPG